jgi:hypothetical protein
MAFTTGICPQAQEDVSFSSLSGEEMSMVEKRSLKIAYNRRLTFGPTETSSEKSGNPKKSQPPWA